MLSNNDLLSFDWPGTLEVVNATNNTNKNRIMKDI